MASGVYKITVGNRFYIGSSRDLTKRQRTHRQNLRTKTHHNVIMQRSWDRHQEFQFEVVEECSESVILDLEQSYLDLHASDPLCMNLTPTAGSPKGYKHTPEALAKMRIASTGKHHSEETRAKISVTRTGMVHSEDTKAKMRTPKSPEHAAKCRANGAKGGRPSLHTK